MRLIRSGVVNMVITHSHFMTSLRVSLIELYTGSDIIYMSVLGQSVLVINKYETAVEILDKRSGIYSSRYVSITLYSFLTGKSIKANV